MGSRSKYKQGTRGNRRSQWSTRTAGLLLLSALLSVVQVTGTKQAPLLRPQDDVAAISAVKASSTPSDLDTQTTTLVDLLSADADLSLFIRMLQHARLIPTLNRLQNATLFAPTNGAINSSSWMLEKHADQDGKSMLDLIRLEPEESYSSETSSSPPPPHDNLNYRLRERLFYHLLNYTWVLPDKASVATSPIAAYETTLLYPTKHEDHGRPGWVPYPEPKDTLLGGEGQKLAIAIDNPATLHFGTRSNKVSSRKNEDRITVRLGVDELGSGGASIVPERGGQARNGKVFVIDGILEPPKSLAHQIKARLDKAEGEGSGSGSGLSRGLVVGNEDAGPRLNRFASLLGEDLWKNLTETSHLTLFAPQDEAFDTLDPLEWKYLTSGFATDDILEIAGNHESIFEAPHRQKVGYLERLIERKDVNMVSGDSVVVARNGDGQAQVNGSLILRENVLASNGVMHIVEKLLLPHGSLALTPEKYLLALNATRFVSLFRNAELSHLLQSSPHNPNNNASYTILATRDDIIERFESQPWQSLPAEGSKELKETLQYHILEGKWTKKQLKDGVLLKTMLQTPELGGNHQRIPVSVTSKKEGGDIGFGSASVISDPIEASGSIIYLVSRILEPPTSFVSTALDKGLSTFVASVYASELDKTLKHSSAITYLAPTNAAFDFMGLAMNYFLLPSAREELGQLLKYHSLKGIVYLSDLPFDSVHYPTLEGSDVFIEQSQNSSKVNVRGPRIGGFPANGDSRDAKITEGDLLTSTGVLHVIDQVELPPTLNVTSEKLMRGAKATTFLDLLKQANMSWVAEGRPAPQAFWNSSPFINLSKRDKDKIRKRFFQRESYTVLCPTDKAFTRINLTHYLNDLPSLVGLVHQHIIPSPPPSKGSLSDPTNFPSDGRPIALEDDRVFPSLLSKSEGGTSKYGDLAFRRAGESDWMVGIKGARGTDGKHDAARIISFGRNTPRFSSGDDDNHDDGGGGGGGRTDGGDVSTQMKRSTKMVFGGGVLLIDAVLEPYRPGWFQRWGWIVLLAFLGLAGTTCIALLGWKLWQRKKEQTAQYEALRQDNEED